MKFSTPLQLLAHKRAGKVVTIALPNGRRVPLAEYLRSWRQLQTLPPQTSVANWEWYELSASEILQKISESVHDRINRHLPWFTTMYRYYHKNQPHSRRLQAKLDSQIQGGRLLCECNWCGTALPSYQSKHNRFCDASCRCAYHS